jgi:signal transduction histidine kinase
MRPRRSIIDNLLENAVEYASPGGSIQITVTTADCRVSNTARGLDEADVARLFDRFWRKESARSSGLHVGLGLPLSRAFAEAMGWTLDARQLPEDRLEIVLAWAQAGSSDGQPAKDHRVAASV